MADVFVSYVRADRPVAAEVAHSLEQAGFAVWWDRHIHIGADFSAEIEREIAAARVVVVLWSRASTGSKWVRDEAAFARDRNKLLPIQIDDAEPPLGFRQVQTLSVDVSNDAERAHMYSDLAAAARKLIDAGAGASHSAKTRETRPQRGTRARYTFGDFALDVAERSLTRRSPAPENRGDAHPARVPLQPKTFDLLVHMVTHSGRLHTKQALLDEVWGDVVVTENSLTRCISQLRTALDDTAEEPRFVETVPRVGYRFIAAVTHEDGPTEPQSADALARPQPGNKERSRRAFVALFALLGVALAYFAADRLWLQRLPESAPSVAVLPFRNLGNDPVNEVLADGIPETLLTMLGQIAELRVIGRTSSFSFKGKDVDLRAIGEALGANAVLEGSVQRSGEQLKINALLVSAVDGVQLWAENFERPITDIFAVQDEIARRVAEALKITLAGKLGPRSAGTQNFEAYQLNLEAKQLLRSRQTKNVERALPKLQRAVELDPHYGDAWVGLVDAYAHSGFEEAAWEAIQRALEVAPETAGPHLALGNWLMHTAGGEGAGAAMARGLALAPQDPVALTSVANEYRNNSGRYAEAAALMRRALKLDPRNNDVRFGAVWAYEANGDLPGALALVQETLRLEPGMGFAHMAAGVMLYGSLGRMDEALRFIRRARSLEPTYPRPELVYGLAQLGMHVEAARELAEERSLFEPDHLLIAHAYLDLLAGNDAGPRELVEQALVAAEPSAHGLLMTVDELGLATTPHEAQRVLERFRAIDPDWRRDPPICTLAWSGDRSGAAALLPKWEKDWRALRAYVAGTSAQNRGTYVARALACTGRNDEALAELEQLVAEGYHAGGWRGLAADRAYDSIRADPRFEALLDRLRAVAEGERQRFLDRPDLTDADVDALVAASTP